MIYPGSKNDYANEILQIVLKNRSENQWYVEPFVGGCNAIDKVKGNRIGNDNNYYLIELLRALQNDWIPPDTISKDQYEHIRYNKEKYPAYLVGFVGFGCSYGRNFFSSYARGMSNNKQKHRNYCLEAKNNLLRQRGNLKGIIFENKKYDELKIPNQSIIYCDPPYKNTCVRKLYGINSFDHDSFWNWVRKMDLAGHKIFVSEYEAPDDFECIWQKKVTRRALSPTSTKKPTEKLFIYKKGPFGPEKRD